MHRCVRLKGPLKRSHSGLLSRGRANPAVVKQTTCSHALQKYGLSESINHQNPGPSLTMQPKPRQDCSLRQASPEVESAPVQQTLNSSIIVDNALPSLTSSPALGLLPLTQPDELVCLVSCSLAGWTSCAAACCLLTFTYVPTIPSLMDTC